MLAESDRKRVHDLDDLLRSSHDLSNPGEAQQIRNRVFREAIELYSRYAASGEAPKENGPPEETMLRDLARHSMRHFSGMADPPNRSLRAYDDARYGPFLGISDEGGVADHICQAAYLSPKARVLQSTDPLTLGVALDGERLTAVGETAIGPDEYAAIRLACMGRILNTTNIGSRLHVRYYEPRPILDLPGASAPEIKAFLMQAKERIRPFLNTPDGVPRPLTLFARLFAIPQPQQEAALRALAEGFSSEHVGDPDHHRLGLYARLPAGSPGVLEAKRIIDLAGAAGLREVAVDGTMREEAVAKISLPGLLSLFTAQETTELLAYAADAGILFSPRNRVDVQTVARNTWQGLACAHRMGFSLGKYGLFPLTLEQMASVMARIRCWFADWSAAPAFYVDLPTIGGTTVYTEDNIAQGLKDWLKSVAALRIPLVLIDTADKDKGRTLLKTDDNNPVGILSLEQVAEIEHVARTLGVKALWAGGMGAREALVMGQLGVFGIYVTTAVSARVAVAGSYIHDEMLASEKAPTISGILHIKLLLEAGFLARNGQIDKLSQAASALLSALDDEDGERIRATHDVLDSLVERAWQRHFQQTGDPLSTHRAPSTGKEDG